MKQGLGPGAAGSDNGSYVTEQHDARPCGLCFAIPCKCCACEGKQCNPRDSEGRTCWRSGQPIPIGYYSEQGR